VVARACVALVAVAVLGWLAVMERDARLLARGVEALQPGSSPGELERAEADLRRARLLNPDTAPDVNRALLYRARGEAERAAATLEDVLRREPDNLVAWAVLGLLARGRDEPAVRRALAAQRRLDPINARRR
jgi:tetratricopeptide (TPR) repeat protein